MRHLSCPFLLLAVLPCLLLGGCGGSSLLTRQPGVSARAAGQATFAVKWPAQTTAGRLNGHSNGRLNGRLIPAAAGSIVLTIKRAGQVIQSQTLVRPASSLTFSALPVGSLTVSAAAYPTSVGTGVVQASATMPLTITSGGTTPLTLTLADTVASLKIYDTAQGLSVGGTLPLAVTALDAANEVVMTSGTITWTSANASVALVNAAGVVSGIAAGSTTITATDSESGASGTFTVSPFNFASAAATPAVSYSSSSFITDGIQYSLGFSFTTGPQPLIVSALGYLNDGATGSLATHQLQIYRVTSGTAAAPTAGLAVLPSPLSVTAAAGNVPAYNTFTYSALPVSIVLAANTTYEIVGTELGEGFGSQAASPVYSGITFGNTVFATNTTTPDFGPSNNSYNNPGSFSVNFRASTNASEPNTLITGTTFNDGSPAYNNNPVSGAAAAFDGDPNTFYDCVSASGGYTGIDDVSPMSVSSIKFAPRPPDQVQSYASRMVNGVFEGSNTSATAGYVTLATVSATPTSGFTNTLTVTDSTAYRWLRYRGPSGGYCNVAEIQFIH